MSSACPKPEQGRWTGLERDEVKSNRFGIPKSGRF
jgi:hypothetical protein